MWNKIKNFFNKTTAGKEYNVGKCVITARFADDTTIKITRYGYAKNGFLSFINDDDYSRLPKWIEADDGVHYNTSYLKSFTAIYSDYTALMIWSKDYEF